MKFRLALATIGIVVWGYGYSVDAPRVRLVGIVLLAIALFLRWIKPRASEDQATN